MVYVLAMARNVNGQLFVEGKCKRGCKNYPFWYSLWARAFKGLDSLFPILSSVIFLSSHPTKHNDTEGQIYAFPYEALCF